MIPQRNNGYDPKSLQVIFLSLLIGQIVFLGVSLIIIRPHIQFVLNFAETIYWTVPTGLILLNLIGQRIFNQQFNQMIEYESIEEKIQLLHRSHIIQWAIVEVGSLIVIALGIQTFNLYFMLIAGMQILYFATLRPKIFTLNEGMTL